MKLLVVFLIFFGQAFALDAECELADGFYRNSPNNLSALKFSTVAEVFSLNNAKTLSFNLDGEDFKFPIRTRFKANKHTSMIFKLSDSSPTRAAHVLIDRKPRKALKSQEFIGNILITPVMDDPENLMLMVQRNDVLTYNFFCRF